MPVCLNAVGPPTLPDAQLATDKLQTLFSQSETCFHYLSLISSATSDVFCVHSPSRQRIVCPSLQGVGHLGKPTLAPVVVWNFGLDRVGLRWVSNCSLAMLELMHLQLLSISRDMQAGTCLVRDEYLLSSDFVSLPLTTNTLGFPKAARIVCSAVA